MNAWNEGEPPHDRPVVILGKLIETSGCQTWCEPVCCEAIWLEEPGMCPGWHFTVNRLSIRQSLEDELVIHYWIDLPGAQEVAA